MNRTTTPRVLTLPVLAGALLGLTLAVFTPAYAADGESAEGDVSAEPVAAPAATTDDGTDANAAVSDEQWGANPWNLSPEQLAQVESRTAATTHKRHRK